MTLNPHQVQRRLRELGLYADAIDGDIGPKSKAAIRAFQRLNGLRSDGIVGPKTWAALFPDPIPERDIVPAKKIGPKGSPWPRQRDVERFYGEVGQNQALMQLPFRMWLAWDLRKSIQAITLHEKVIPSAERVFRRILEEYGPKRIDELDLDLFGGSFNVRKMRGGNNYSMHSWGIAIDFDPENNQLRWGRDRARLDAPDYDMFWRFWEEEGWLSLGRAKNFDWMHVQAALL